MTGHAAAFGSDVGYPYKYGPVNQADKWGFATRNCTSFVAWKLNTSNVIHFHNNYDGRGGNDFGNARNWKAAAKRFNLRVDSNPSPGSVAWLKNGNHVAWVESVNGNLINIQEYNYGYDEYGNLKYEYNERQDYKNKYEYIHFGDSNINAFTPGVYNNKGRNHELHLTNKNRSGSANRIFRYGNNRAHHTVVAGDWDGNGTSTVGVVGNSGNNLRWYLRNSNSGGGANYTFNYGRVGDIPVVGDWDGNGTVTVGVVRKIGNNLRWYVRNANSAGPTHHSFNYGSANGTPITGDWNGNGTWSQGVVYKHSSGNLRWLLRDSLNGGAYQKEIYYGTNSMKPITGDWDGDGTFTPGAVQKTSKNLRWFLRNSNTSGVADINFIYGSRNHKPIVGDWDGKK